MSVRTNFFQKQQDVYTYEPMVAVTICTGPEKNNTSTEKGDRRGVLQLAEMLSMIDSF